MPRINKYECNKCELSLPEGWGGYVYIVNDKGKRECIPHPLDMAFFRKMGLIESFFENVFNRKEFKQWMKKVESRGFNSHCICFDCLKQFDLDIRDTGRVRSSQRYPYVVVKTKDERKCPHCNSQNVKTTIELIGNICPKCKDGIIKEIDTGAIS